MTFGRRPMANITLSDAIVLPSDSRVTNSSPACSIAATVWPQVTVMPRAAHFLAQVFADIVVEAAQDIFAAIDQRHSAAQPRKDAGEFHRDIAAALDDDALGQSLQMERLVRGDRVFDAGNLRPVMRPGAGRDQDRLGMHAFATGQAHGVGVFQHGAALDQRDLEALERRCIGGFQPRHFALHIGDQRRPMECRFRHGPAEPGGVPEFIGKPRGINQQLLRHAAADDAGAADPVFLRDHHARAIARRDRAPRARRPSLLR